jgi:curved DNA-binding protein CbpA/Tfp pilus assembly protein PilZ
MDKDKRKHKRHNKRLFTKFGNAQPDKVGYTEDVSSDGLFIKTNAVLSSGTELVIQLTLSDNRVIQLKGRVKWTKYVPPALLRHVKKTGIGVQLDCPPEDFQSLVKSIEGLEVVEEAADASPDAGEEAPSDVAVLSVHEIRAAHAELEEQDYYQLLGVTREVGPVEIKRAYYRVAKRYHPDRYGDAGFADVIDQLKILFVRINTAYHTLSVTERKQAYDLEIAEQTIGHTRGEKPGQMSAEGHVAQGRRSFKEGHLKTAVHHFELAVKAAPHKGAYHALLAQALSHLPARMREAETHYKRAIELEPARPEHHIHLGRLYKKVGLPARALEQFEQTLKWDPDNRPARDEILALKK